MRPSVAAPWEASAARRRARTRCRRCGGRRRRPPVRRPCGRAAGAAASASVARCPTVATSDPFETQDGLHVHVDPSRRVGCWPTPHRCGPSPAGEPRRLEAVAEPLPLGAQVRRVVGVLGGDQRHPADDLDARAPAGRRSWPGCWSAAGSPARRARAGWRPRSRTPARRRAARARGWRRRCRSPGPAARRPAACGRCRCPGPRGRTGRRRRRGPRRRSAPWPRAAGGRSRSAGTRTRRPSGTRCAPGRARRRHRRRRRRPAPGGSRRRCRPCRRGSGTPRAPSAACRGHPLDGGPASVTASLHRPDPSARRRPTRTRT